MSAPAPSATRCPGGLDVFHKAGLGTVPGYQAVGPRCQGQPVTATRLPTTHFPSRKGQNGNIARPGTSPNARRPLGPLAPCAQPAASFRGSTGLQEASRPPGTVSPRLGPEVAGVYSAGCNREAEFSPSVGHPRSLVSIISAIYLLVL